MKTKTVKVAPEGFGSFLGREKGCLAARLIACDSRMMGLIVTSLLFGI